MKKYKDEKNCLREPTVLKEPYVKKGSIVTLSAEIVNSGFAPEIWKLRIIDTRESGIYSSSGIDYCTSNSPLGLAIMGATVGDIGKYKTDNGFAYRVKILDIENSE